MGLKKTRPIIILGIALASFVAVPNFILPLPIFATDYSSSNFTVKDPLLDAGGKSSSSSSFSSGQSLFQNATGKSSSSSFQLWSGFQYFFKISANTLSATAGDGQVSLSWTVPQTALGVNIVSYDLGVGTASGSYTYQNV